VGKVTLQTIADEVGVSRMSVSNAFSKPDQLSTELRARILEVADRLGYAGPDPVARSLRGGRVGAVGVLVTETLGYAFKDPYALALLAGIAEAVGESDTSLLLVPLPPGSRSASIVQQAVVDGFVAFILPDNHPAIDAVATRELPLVTVDGPRLDWAPFVGIDERLAAQDITDHVLLQGHRRLLVLTFRVIDDDHVGVVAPQRLDHATYRVSRERLRGVLDATRAVGLDDGEVTIHDVGDQRADLVRRAVRDELARPDPPTAIIALSDRIALEVLATLADAGAAVPGQVSVTGFDDLEQAAPAGLTTIRQPAADKGRLAGQLLTTDVAPPTDLLPHRLVLRATVGPPHQA
jgi:DNA-binding LacI/PurR family transcriptional regulator